MLALVATLLFISFYILFLGFIRFCEWVLSRREATS